MPEIKPVWISRELIGVSLFYDSVGLIPMSKGTWNGVTFQTDEFGFRKNSVRVTQSGRSWLSLGDSVTMGPGIEADSTFSGRLQARYDTLNILKPSVLGFNARDYFNVFRTFVFDKKFGFEIDHVTICWCLNDVYIDVKDSDMPGGNIRWLLSDLLRYIRLNSGHTCT